MEPVTRPVLLGWAAEALSFLPRGHADPERKPRTLPGWGQCCLDLLGRVHQPRWALTASSRRVKVCFSLEELKT